jgi:hypothetical protein
MILVLSPQTLAGRLLARQAFHRRPSRARPDAGVGIAR